MVRVHFDEGQVVEVEDGTKLKEAYAKLGRIKDFPCGGKGKCSQCKVNVSFVPELTEDSMEEVLACSYEVTKDIWVKEKGNLGGFETEILTSGSASKYTLNPGINLEGKDDSWGLAFDIGTTTVVGYLESLRTGNQISVAAELNRQRVYGADVISRITAAQDTPENLQDLQNRVIDTLNSIIDQLVQKTGIDREQIYMVTVAGNTCMHHLFLGLNPKSLGRAPFLPVIQEAQIKTAAELNIKINPKAKVWVFPVIAGFVGGDTVAAVLASDLHKQKGIKMLVDIGTNGELVLNVKGRMRSCSAAAGPALEGAQVSCGMRADTGAISRVQLEPEIRIEVIGDTNPKGICGSGLIDLLGELVRVKAVSYKGGFIKPEKYNGPEYIKERIIKGERGYSFVLIKAEDNNGQEIIFTQDDLLQLQLAKGALNAASELLVKEAGITGDQVEEIFLAGAFGNFLDKNQALQIGLFSEWAQDKIKNVGNAAGEGAKMALLSIDKMEEAKEISKQLQFLEFAGTKDFNDAFIDGMLFEKAK